MWELDCEENWALKNWCFWTVVLEKTLESPLACKEIQPVHSKGDQSWDFFGRNDAKAETPVVATSCEELSHWKRLWCWEGLGAGGEGDNRVWDGWMASLTRWKWVWVNSGSWWWTGRPGVLRFMGLQRVGHNWATELNYELRDELKKIVNYVWFESSSKENYWLQTCWTLLSSWIKLTGYCNNTVKYTVYKVYQFKSKNLTSERRLKWLTSNFII